MTQHPPLTKRQSETLSNGGQIVVLSQDDLLTLKLLRDWWNQSLFEHRGDKRLNIETLKLVETLNRILNQ